MAARSKVTGNGWRVPSEIVWHQWRCWEGVAALQADFSTLDEVMLCRGKSLIQSTTSRGRKRSVEPSRADGRMLFWERTRAQALDEVGLTRGQGRGAKNDGVELGLEGGSLGKTARGRQRSVW